MKRGLALAAALIVTIGVTMGAAVFAGAHIIRAVERPATTATYSMQVGGLTRSWQVIAPDGRAPASAPIIVVLSGIAASNGQEISRDRLLPYVDAGKTELVYPLAIRQSWNAVGCCGAAGPAEGQRPGLPREARSPGSTPGGGGRSTSSATATAGRMAYASRAPTPACSTAWPPSRPTRCPAAWSAGRRTSSWSPRSTTRGSPTGRGRRAGKRPRPRSRSPGCRRPSAARRRRRSPPTDGVMTSHHVAVLRRRHRLAWGVCQSGRPQLPAADRPVPPRPAQVIWSFFTPHRRWR